MALWDDYAVKSTPEDTDTLMMKDNSEVDGPNKRVLLSGLFTWLQNKIHSLAVSSATHSETDKLIMDRNGTIARVDYSTLAKAIIEQYAGSTLAGTSQSLQVAIGALNDRIGDETIKRKTFVVEKISGSGGSNPDGVTTFTFENGTSGMFVYMIAHMLTTPVQQSNYTRIVEGVVNCDALGNIYYNEIVNTGSGEQPSVEKVSGVRKKLSFTNPSTRQDYIVHFFILEGSDSATITRET